MDDDRSGYQHARRRHVQPAWKLVLHGSSTAFARLATHFRRLADVSPGLFYGSLFLMAGYFVPPAYDRRGPLLFVRDRTIRLGLPVLFYMFVLGPITEYFCSKSWTSTETTSFRNEWIKHIRNGEFLQENGPLWFCLALLIFSIVYAGCRSPRTIKARRVTYPQPTTTTPQLISFAALMAAATFVVRLIVPPGTTILNLHIGDFPQYILMFNAGILAARGPRSLAFDESAGIRWLVTVLPVGFVIWLIVLLKGGATSGNSGAYAGGWHWQSASMNAWESFTCVGICYGLLAIFSTRFNTQGPVARSSRITHLVYMFFIRRLSSWQRACCTGCHGPRCLNSSLSPSSVRSRPSC
jgi:glucans biosynthesis protein C